MKRIKEIVRQKVKGEKIHIERPPEVEAKSLMVALRETLKQLERNESPHLPPYACKGCQRSFFR